MINASVVETCRLNNIDPTGYLIFAYDKLQVQQNNKKIETKGLMPWDVSKEQFNQMWKKYEANPMRDGLDWFINYFNSTRPHQSLGYYAPNDIYYNAFVGAAKKEEKLIKYS